MGVEILLSLFDLHKGRAQWEQHSARNRLAVLR
jgi:hypothetical protein